MGVASTLINPFATAAAQFQPTVAEVSRWYCSDARCDGEPHSGWTWKHARGSQHPPPGDWYVWLLLSGRGWGKTRCGAEWLASQVRLRPGCTWGVVARTSGDARDTCMEGESGLLRALGMDRDSNGYDRAKGTIRFEDSVIHSYSAEKPDSIRGPNFAGAWCDELASWKYEESWTEGLLPAVRIGDTRIVVTTTPKPTKLIKGLVTEADVIVTKGATDENRANLSPHALAALERRYAGTRLGRQELLGELIEDIEGALWRRAMFEPRAKMNEALRERAGMYA